MDNKVKCPICNREIGGAGVSPVRPGPEHAFLCPYWREDPEENSDRKLFKGVSPCRFNSMKR